MTVFSCELLNPNEWREAEREAAERGRKCYKYPSGNVYCEDTKQGKYELKKMNKWLYMYMKRICQNNGKIRINYISQLYGIPQQVDF